MADWVTGRQWGLYLHMLLNRGTIQHSAWILIITGNSSPWKDSHFLSSPPVFSSFLYLHFFTYCNSFFLSLPFLLTFLIVLSLLTCFLILNISSLPFASPLCLFLCGDGVTRWRFMLISPWSHSRDILTESWFSNNMILTRPRSLIQSKL